MSVLAFDLGASSGRALIGQLKDRTIRVEEIHRFPNEPVQIGGRLHWDILRLFHELKQGLLRTKASGIQVESLGIDSWAVDFGLLDQRGELMANPFHYRDSHTDGVMEKVFETVPAQAIFAKTGIQFLSFNTIYQLAAIRQSRPYLLQEASRLLMIPDLLRYWLTGEMANEFTNATTTQLFNPSLQRWDPELLNSLHLPSHLFEQVVHPGTETGALRAAITGELGLPKMKVYTVAEHDTASAVVAVPALERSFAYLSCGTWSLMGTEVAQPVIHDRARELNFTNEGGAYGTYRLLKNIMGLWILQECQRTWQRQGLLYSYPELVMMSEAEPAFSCFINPDDPLFLPAGDMPQRIAAYARRTGQQVPQSPGAIVRCIMESLALQYRHVLECTEELSNQRFSGLHMVGGGIHNETLCQWTASAIGKPVWAGPAEGSAIGNMAVQWIASGELSDIWEARALIRDSFPVTIYEPADREAWENAFGRFCQITKSTTYI
ncbi:rhamnulokinase family protein [Paenibacillus sp. FSL M8-0334]|uniref:Rhamnulokinase n=1 Tax=Paenibacillus campinasensis TaxID=66347 RepID=A0ABW9T471_9BACL|nr:rhamnulokinase family protein [Paenibacillus campinasensis]MUG67497.1 rhamnulokinase [Paenibacillus campinasensis]